LTQISLQRDLTEEKKSEKKVTEFGILSSLAEGGMVEPDAYINANSIRTPNMDNRLGGTQAFGEYEPSRHVLFKTTNDGQMGDGH
jgi:hypothetical protein